MVFDSHPFVQYSTELQRENGIWFPETPWYDNNIGYYFMSNFWVPMVSSVMFILGSYSLMILLYFAEQLYWCITWLVYDGKGK